ncbi:hypothetical protein B296_00016399 [Ensete ventricosum]|uniref:Uncharacterized protein n=1 Tax=Ensete ventricosum TaxID=4639 RepID=A0A427AV13_ENSVE|nr:hypothetical protein B296_00016399 [Ensete ventricosum]
MIKTERQSSEPKPTENKQYGRRAKDRGYSTELTFQFLDRLPPALPMPVPLGIALAVRHALRRPRDDLNPKRAVREVARVGDELEIAVAIVRRGVGETGGIHDAPSSANNSATNHRRSPSLRCRQTPDPTVPPSLESCRVQGREGETGVSFHGERERWTRGERLAAANTKVNRRALVCL